MQVKTTPADGSVTFADYQIQEYGDPCCLCGQRAGTIEVYGIPGGVSYWCDLCLVRSQLETAVEAAAKIPELKARLARLLDG